MQTSKIKIGAITQATPAVRPNVILEELKLSYTGTIVESPRAHKYNTQSRIHQIHQVTTFNNTPTVFPMDPKTKNFTEVQTMICV